MTSKEAKAYITKVVKTKTNPSGSTSMMIGKWVIDVSSVHTYAKDQVRLIRQAILETIMVDCVISSDTEQAIDFKKEALEEVRNTGDTDIDVSWLADVMETWFNKGKKSK